MNLRIYNRCVEISKALKSNKISGKSFHTSFIIKKSKIVCIGINNYQKRHNVKRFGVYENYRNLPGKYEPSLHSEVSSLIRYGEEDLSDCEFLNIRIDNNQNTVLSMPCPNCQRTLRSVNPKRIYFSNKDGNCEELILE